MELQLPRQDVAARVLLDVAVNAEQTMPRRARAELRRWAARRGIPSETTGLAELACSELVTNAVVHGGGLVAVEVSDESDALVLSVSDGSPTLPAMRDVAPDAQGGRGLYIVACIAASWGVRGTPEGKTVWCRIPRT